MLFAGSIMLILEVVSSALYHPDTSTPPKNPLAVPLIAYPKVDA
jgi:hypothetical protein